MNPSDEETLRTHFVTEFVNDKPVGHLVPWGSECLRCENTTPHSQFCDNCGKNDRTTPLWIRPGLPYDDAVENRDVD